jgi:hypothetical protein
MFFIWTLFPLKTLFLCMILFILMFYVIVI